jgi:predicted P-loop ATPase
MNKDSKNESEKDSNGEKPPRISLPKLETRLNKLYDFRNNIIDNRIEMKYKEKAEFKPVNELSIYRELHHMSFPIGLNTLRYLLGSDYIQEYDPIKDYFLKLEGKFSTLSEDYVKKFLKYIITSDPHFSELIIKHWMVSAIRCVFESGYANKTILVLFNTIQDSGKTSVANFFIPSELKRYSSINSLRGKDGLVGLYNTFIQILDEMSDMNNIPKQEFKSLISLPFISVRPPYAINRVNRDRITSFLGTSDRQSFLHEDVGTARFMVVEINAIDFGYSKLDVNCLWAQAYHYYKNGKHNKLDDELRREIRERNKRYIQGSVLTETIDNLIIPSENEKEGTFLQTKDILNYIYANSTQNKISEKSIAESLNNLKFTRTSKYIPERKQSVYGYYVKFRLHDEK